MPKNNDENEQNQPAFDADKALKRLGTLETVLEAHPNDRIQMFVQDYKEAVTDAQNEPSKDNIKSVRQMMEGLKGQVGRQERTLKVKVYSASMPQRVGGGGGESEATKARNAEVERIRTTINDGTMTATELFSALYNIRLGIRANPKTGDYKPLEQYITDNLTLMADLNLKEEATEE